MKMTILSYAIKRALSDPEYYKEKEVENEE